MKFVTKNKKWETIVIAVPKIASDFRDAIDGYDFQMAESSFNIGYLIIN
jgi:hypothetical protein